MDREWLADEMIKLSRGSYEDGMRMAVKMARDMSDKMLDGSFHQLDGVAALQLLATMVERVIAMRAEQT